MNTNIIRMMLTGFIMAATLVYGEAPLKIYLPRDIAIEGGDPNLGQVAIIRGSEPLASTAARVAMGRISSPDQSLVISRTLVLSRLACSGIPASNVVLTGAEATVVTRQHQRIAGSRLAEAATAFLNKHLPDKSICQLDIIRSPNDLILPGQADNITLECRPVAHATKNQSKVQVVALQGGKEIGQQEVVFKFRYQCRKAITTKAIAKGTSITAENTAVKGEISNYPEPAGWVPPFGLIANRDLAANTVITEKCAGPALPALLVKRNQGVLIKIDRSGLMATANGKALQDGKAGDCIKVQNVDSQVILTATVNNDGTVAPIF